MMMIGLIDFPWTKTNATAVWAGVAQSTQVALDFDHLEVGFGDAAVRALPVVRDIGPASAGWYAFFRHADILVINETANDALV
jgi:hypothetical protein